MSGTRAGGQRAAQTNRQRHGEDFYQRIGKTGGTNGHTGGFASDIVGKDGLTGRQRATVAGIKGGKKSRRGRHDDPISSLRKQWQNILHHKSENIVE